MPCICAKELNDPRDLYKLIKIFGRKIQYQYLSDYVKIAGINNFGSDEKIHLKKPDDNNLWIDPFSDVHSLGSWLQENTVFKKESRKVITVDLSNDIVLTWPWRRERFNRALERIGEGKQWGPWNQDQHNHQLYCWESIGIVFVGGGNHSLTTGVVDHVGTVKTRWILDMAHLYKHITCDGEHFWFEDQGKKKSKIIGVQNIDFAIIYEIGRILNDKGVKYWSATPYKKSPS